MHQIKQLPQDFIVKEISNVNLEINGQYAYYTLKKTNYTTIDALQILSQKFKIPLKNIGFAGNKDKNAVTEQKISVFRGSKSFENIKFSNIELEYLGNGREPISLGGLEGNEFIITIRNLEGNEIKKIQKFQNKRIKIPNIYGPQRFSKNNNLVGKAIIKREFRKAVELILENNGILEEQVKQYLENNKNNYVEALRQIPFRTRRIFVHSYQSLLFNRIASEFLKISQTKRNIKIPIIGFNFELKAIKNKPLKNIIQKILNEENLNSRDFIISQMPELTSEGGFRDLFFELKDLKVIEIDYDESSKNKQKVKINFKLSKSCYATVALEFLFQ